MVNIACLSDEKLILLIKEAFNLLDDSDKAAMIITLVTQRFQTIETEMKQYKDNAYPCG